MCIHRHTHTLQKEHTLATHPHLKMAYCWASCCTAGSSRRVACTALRSAVLTLPPDCRMSATASSRSHPSEVLSACSGVLVISLSVHTGEWETWTWKWLTAAEVLNACTSAANGGRARL